MRVLVTGRTGFVGKKLVKKFIKHPSPSTLVKLRSKNPKYKQYIVYA